MHSYATAKPHEERHLGSIVFRALRHRVLPAIDVLPHRFTGHFIYIIPVDGRNVIPVQLQNLKAAAGRVVAFATSGNHRYTHELITLVKIRLLLRPVDANAWRS